MSKPSYLIDVHGIVHKRPYLRAGYPWCVHIFNPDVIKTATHPKGPVTCLWCAVEKAW